MSMPAATLNASPDRCWDVALPADANASGVLDVVDVNGLAQLLREAGRHDAGEDVRWSARLDEVATGRGLHGFHWVAEGASAVPPATSWSISSAA